jgi:hypothetical protein
VLAAVLSAMATIAVLTILHRGPGAETMAGAAAPATTTTTEAVSTTSTTPAVSEVPTQTGRPPRLVFDYGGDGSSSAFDRQQAAAAYLQAIVRGDWATVSSMLCAPLRAAFPSSDTVATRVTAEVTSSITGFGLLPGPSGGTVVRYSLVTATGTDGPFDLRLVSEGGSWRMCGSERVDGIGSYLVAGP